MSYQPLWQLKDILNLILDYMSRISFLSEMRAPWTWRLQVDTVWTVTASLAAAQTLATVTTVTTLSNQTSVWWYGAQNQIPALMNIEATLANIDNIYIS